MHIRIISGLLCATMLASHAALAEDEDAALSVPSEPHIVSETVDKPLPKTAAPESVASGLTLQTALARVLKHSPRLVSAAALVGARAGSHSQAGMWSNPELGVMSENIGGTGLYKGYDAAESTLSLSQRIEIGGKITGREAVASQDLRLSQTDQVAAYLALIHDTKVAYAEAVAAQESLRLANEQKELADDLFAEVTMRVNAAREPLIQKSKAEITVTTAAFEAERSGRELEHAKHVLASLWGGHHDAFALDSSDFFRRTPPISEEEAESKFEQSPDMQRMRATEERQKAALALERASAVPDPTVSASVRDFRNSNDQAFVVGVSIPLPVLNRNQGNIESARQLANKAAADTQSFRLSERNKLFEARETAVNAYRHLETMESSTLPAAEKAFKLSRQGYRAGKFPYLEVLDAQRTLFTVKEQHITALRDYQVAQAAVERLTTSPQTTFMTTDKREADHEE